MIKKIKAMPILCYLLLLPPKSNDDTAFLENTFILLTCILATKHIQTFMMWLSYNYVSYIPTMTDTEIPKYLLQKELEDPITLEQISDPIILLQSGHTYSQDAFIAYSQNAVYFNRDPSSGMPLTLPATYAPNIAIDYIIHAYDQPGNVIKFSEISPYLLCPRTLSLMHDPYLNIHTGLNIDRLSLNTNIDNMAHFQKNHKLRQIIDIVKDYTPPMSGLIDLYEVPTTHM